MRTIATAASRDAGAGLTTRTVKKGVTCSYKARGIKPRLQRRANKHHPTLPARLRRYNQMIGRHRAAVQTTFATWKRRMGLSDIRYLGRKRAPPSRR